MKIGLFFGSFNPIHIGHLIIANHLVENSPLDQIWLVVTPQNPFKSKSSLLDNHQRLEMVFRATKEYPKLIPSDIEFGLSQPNYTIHTLTYLKEKFPQHEFALIMGTDNLNSLHKWKNYEQIINHHSLYIYPRVTEIKSKNKLHNHKNVTIVEAPKVEISATAIRKSLKIGKNIRPLLSESVWTYIDEMNFYKK